MNPPEDSPCKLYKVRWVILFLFVVCCASSTMQWLQYSIIADIIVKYYDVSYEAVDWSSMVYLLAYIPFIFPGSYILDKYGLRTAVLLGTGGTCLGAWLKVASTAPNRFWLVLLGQIVVGSSGVFFLAVPAPLAATWFGPNEVSSACSVGVFGTQAGTAISFLLPPILVKGNQDAGGIERDLSLMAISTAVVNTVLLILLLIFFKAEPPTPPSVARLKSQTIEQATEFWQPLRRLMTNKSYVLLLVSYGINLGIFNGMSALLNQIVLKHYPDSAEDAGRIGMILVVSGIIGSVSCGVVLDRFNRYRETIVGLYVLSLLGMMCFTFTVDKGIVVVYVVAVLLGFSMTGLLPVGFEVAAELTYPTPEGTSSGLLMAAAQALGILFTYLYSCLFYNFVDLYANLVMSASLAVGLILLVCIRFELRRQAAYKVDQGAINEAFSMSKI